MFWKSRALHQTGSRIAFIKWPTFCSDELLANNFRILVLINFLLHLFCRTTKNKLSNLIGVLS